MIISLSWSNGLRSAWWRSSWNEVFIRLLFCVCICWANVNTGMRVRLSILFVLAERIRRIRIIIIFRKMRSLWRVFCQEWRFTYSISLRFSKLRFYWMKIIRSLCLGYLIVFWSVWCSAYLYFIVIMHFLELSPLILSSTFIIWFTKFSSLILQFLFHCMATQVKSLCQCQI